ncbi:copper amine oxidase N-terminal domain-containing protein [Paenibacillus sp. P96]|uniref:Copper amine oxidase N-terminal domain-containing protein n=1 Tax=Paenibacillus zeirhizosphaerae TaxID=2987519 RepID=A0ABT9FPA4_9BACL|nr:stalk domain-containing protein [Paenibacillus sp. P96]MDP4096237.1 copper amine oxidase N-terminal domain-containing protein [Paenibacillus sp. P96]
MKFKKPVIITAVSALAVSAALLTQPTYAAQATKTIKAVYNNIAIVYNGNTVPSDASTEPFMINGTTYLPLRMVGTALDKKVTWDGSNKRVVIEDNAAPVDNSTVTALNNQINTLNQQLTAAKSEAATKDATIAQLQKDKAALQAQIDSNKNNNNNNNSSSNISDLEDDLNDDFGNYEDTDSEIVLSGNKDKVTLRVNVDKKGWDKLSSSKKTNLIQDIVDDIRDTYKDATISGTVRDDSSSDTLSTISVRSSGVASVTEESSGLEVSELEDEIQDDFSTYKNVKFDIRLSGDEDKVTVRVYVKKDDWNGLSVAQRSDFKDDIVEAIENEYEDADIAGTIFDSSDNSRLDTFDN